MAHINHAGSVCALLTSLRPPSMISLRNFRCYPGNPKGVQTADGMRLRAVHPAVSCALTGSPSSSGFTLTNLPSS